MMAKYTILLLFVLNFTATWQLKAQKFKVTALLGLNAAQIDGDSLYGYKKLGLHVGGRLSYVNNKSFDVALEMLYCQRGAAKSFANNSPEEVISTNYVEIPIIINIRDWYIEDRNYHKIRAEFGLSFARLLDANSLKYDVTNFKKNDISWVLGAGIRFSPSWGIALRYTSSLNAMYDDSTDSLPRLKSYFLTFRSEFYF
jgi:Outer membrane protein beta-barrel domain